VTAARFEEIVRESAAAVRELETAQDVGAAVARLADAVARSLAAGGTLWLFGNGGSAADAQHFAAEFVGRFREDRRPLAAIALTTNTSALTAIANDYGFEHVFSRQLEAHARPGDVAVGISTSGKSPNVRSGLEAAGRLGLTTGALTGGDGGDLRAVASECIVVPASSTARIQECHIVIGHALSALVEEQLLGDGS
jgi:D-sedoheptulose 7-phosphate isomerase